MIGGLACVSCTGKYDNISFKLKTPFQWWNPDKLLLIINGRCLELFPTRIKFNFIFMGYACGAHVLSTHSQSH